MEKLLKDIYGNEKKKLCLKIVGTVAVYLSAVFFGLGLLLLIFEERYVTAAELAVTMSVGYVAVTVVRRLINAPRPYELYDFYEVKPKDKSGQSFPSRHCYCAFAIATLLWVVHPLVTVGLLIASLVIALTRVLLGIHFIRDVVCGALIGIITGVTGILLDYIL
ncbi:MAG: phosphatase PAP2 family protein [Clostridia bacterium]|nr:phosphatase PAP2 family protein [Clostridia bacterium]